MDKNYGMKCIDVNNLEHEKNGFKYVKNICQALKLFYKNDIQKMQSNSQGRRQHESSYSFRLAHYLAVDLECYHDGKFIDYEYHGDSNTDANKKCIPRYGKNEEDPIRVDIIYHDRYQENEFCMEIKKDGVQDDANKVNACMKKYNYKEGYCICSIRDDTVILCAFHSRGMKAQWKIKM